MNVLSLLSLFSCLFSSVAGAVGCGKHFTTYEVRYSGLSGSPNFDYGIRCVHRLDLHGTGGISIIGGGTMFWYGEGYFNSKPYRYVGMADPISGETGSYRGPTGALSIKNQEEIGNADEIKITRSDRGGVLVVTGNYGLGSRQEEWIAREEGAVINPPVFIGPSAFCGSRFKAYSVTKAGEPIALVKGFRCEFLPKTAGRNAIWYGQGEWNSPYAHLGVRREDNSAFSFDLKLGPAYSEFSARSLTFKDHSDRVDYVIPEWGEAWSAQLDNLPYNQVRFLASHNSYDKKSFDPTSPTQKLPLETQVAWGVRSFEFDMHNTEGVGEWRISHTTGFGDHCGLLSTCLGILWEFHKNNGAHEPITIFLQTSGWQNDGHKPKDLDAALDRLLGDKMYTPMMMRKDCPGTSTLQDAVGRCGWPTIQALRGKFIVVLMDNHDDIRGYINDTRGYDPATLAGDNGYLGHKNCFTAPEANATNVFKDFVNSVVFNVHNTEVAGLSAAAYRLGFVSRMWRIDSDANMQTAIAERVHHIATDHVSMDLFKPLIGVPYRRAEGM